MSEPYLEAEALGRLFEKYRAEMTGKTRNLLRTAGIPPSWADADDIVSTAFVTVLATTTKKDNPRAYLYAVIRNEVKRVERRLILQNSIQADRTIDEYNSDSPPVEPDFSGLLADCLTVRGAVNALPAPQATAVWDFYGLGYTRQEVADERDMHPGTVAQNVWRARIMLQTVLMGVLAIAVLIIAIVGGAHDGVAIAGNVWLGRRPKDEESKDRNKE